MHPLRALALAIGLALVAAACGPGGSNATPAPSAAGSASACQSGPVPASVPGWGPEGQHPTVIPVIINAPAGLTCGQNRFLFSFLSLQNQPVAAPDRKATVTFYDLSRNPTKPVATADGHFLWAIQDTRGDYSLNVTFPEAGLWGAEFKTSAPGSAEETIRVQFQVHETTSVVRVGQPAPASRTPTATTPADIAKIATDPNPDPAFYTTSVDQALAQHKPFVLVFATPKFCVSAQCGPTLDRVKPFATKHPGVTFINVEPYQLHVVDGQLQPILDANNQLQVVPAASEWGLLSEPWIFVVGKDGIVRASFEGVVGDDELEAAIKTVE